MITICCKTNLDLGHAEKWPTSLPAVPMVGHSIISGMVWDNNFQLRLEVYSVTWRLNNMEWIAEVELHIPKVYNMSIADFYNWYAPKIGKFPSHFI